MNLLKCDKGHYYDGDRFAFCPHCPSGQGFGDDEGSTLPVDLAPVRDCVPAMGAASGPESGSAADSQAPLSERDLTVGWLVCTKGVNRGRDYRLYTGCNTIGRSADNSVALLGDNSVSREGQAEIVYEPGDNKFYALPGNSQSLAYLNGDVLLEKTEMNKYDVLELGQAFLMLIPLCDDKFSWNGVFAD